MALGLAVDGHTGSGCAGCHLGRAVAAVDHRRLKAFGDDDADAAGDLAVRVRACHQSLFLIRQPMANRTAAIAASTVPRSAIPTLPGVSSAPMRTKQIAMSAHSAASWTSISSPARRRVAMAS